MGVVNYHECLGNYSAQESACGACLLRTSCRDILLGKLRSTNPDNRNVVDIWESLMIERSNIEKKAMSLFPDLLNTVDPLPYEVKCSAPVIAISQGDLKKASELAVKMLYEEHPFEYQTVNAHALSEDLAEIFGDIGAKIDDFLTDIDQGKFDDLDTFDFSERVSYMLGDLTDMIPDIRHIWGEEHPR